jgi:electron transfer flavoprotein alpha subunit
MKRVLIIAHFKQGVLKNNTFKLISKAKEFDYQVAVIVFGSTLDSLIPILISAGSNSQFLVNVDDAKLLSSSTYSKCILQAVARFEADSVWFTSCESSKDIAPRVAASLNTLCVTEVVDIKTKAGETRLLRPAFAGKILQNIAVCVQPIVIIIRAGTFDVVEGLKGSEHVEEIELPEPDTKARLKKIVVEVNSEIDLSDADIIVSVGRGVQDKKGIKLVKELADEIKAGLGATRAIVDAGLMPHNTQIGQTGKIVSPNLYIAVGISGSIHHIAGINNSKVILAVNSDPEAPIFKIANYGIVGDLFDVIPILRREIKKIAISNQK